MMDFNEMMLWERNIHMDTLREYIKQENLKITENNFRRR